VSGCRTRAVWADHAGVSKAIVLTVFAAAAILLFAVGPLAQPQAYHDYADARELAGIPHFWNVMSNVPFLVVGLAGLWWTTRSKHARLLAERGQLGMWIVLFAGEILTSFGSAYYHAVPNNGTLVRDRVVFSLMLTSFFTIVRLPERAHS
jgi:hypothetical protein